MPKQGTASPFKNSKGVVAMSKETSHVPVEKQSKAPSRGQGWDLFTSLHNEADKLFREFSQRWPAGLLAPGASESAGLGAIWGGRAPAVDIVDLDDAIEVRAELPGIDQKDIDVEISEGTLTIRAEKREEKEEGKKENHFYLSERHYGSFQRMLRLPEAADVDKADASFANGVLTVRFPKTKEALKKPKKVAIK